MGSFLPATGCARLRHTLEPLPGFCLDPPGTVSYPGLWTDPSAFGDNLSGNLIGQAETPSPIHALALTGQGTQVASGSADGVIRIWPSRCNQTPLTPLAPLREINAHPQTLTSLDAVGNDGKQLLSAGEDGMVRHWNWAEERQIQQMNHGAPVTSVAASLDGLRFASAGLDGVARLWRSADGSLLAEMKGTPRLPTASRPAWIVP